MLGSGSMLMPETAGTDFLSIKPSMYPLNCVISFLNDFLLYQSLLL